jgi:tRNA (adenine57-N1/adenine58-N1)-methyltransferase
MKVLIHKEKRQIVDGREYIVAKGRQYFVTDFSKDVATLYGTVAKEDLSKPSGSVIKTKDTGKEFVLIDASFIDIYKRIRKLPQTIPLKDIGLIIAETGINHESSCVDGGLGSGALASALAHIAKHVTSYEIREDCIKTAEANIKKLGLNNITIKMKSLYDGIDEKEADLITLDVPEPWKVIPHAAKALKIGGWIVSYSPSVPQVQDFVAELHKNEQFLYLKTVELIERLWEIEGRRVRPKSTGIGHSGFLTFARKIKA